MTTPEEARDDALERVEKNANEEWKARAYKVVRRLAYTQLFITTDDVWALLAGYEERTHEPRAMGAVMRRASRDLLIAPTDSIVNSSSVVNHKRALRVWRSLVY